MFVPAESKTTDGGGGSVDDAVQPQCDSHEHFEMSIVDEEIAIDVDEMFSQLFTDSPLFAEFIRRRKTSGLFCARRCRRGSVAVE